MEKADIALCACLACFILILALAGDDITTIVEHNSFLNTSNLTYDAALCINSAGTLNVCNGEVNSTGGCNCTL